MKKLMFLLLGIIMVISLAACSGGENASGDSGGSSGDEGGDEQVTLRMAWWGSQPRHDYTLEVIKMYEEKNPNVKIQAEYASWEDYWKKLAPQAAANELPDIIQMDLSYLAQYGENGQLADMSPFIGEQIDVSNISDAVVDGGKIGDKLYGFNLGVDALSYMHDPAMLKEIGVDSIPEDWTWEDYQEIAKKAADAGYFIDTSAKADVFFNYYLRTKGKSLYSADGTSLGYQDDQYFVDFFGMLAELVKEGASPTPDYLAQVKGIEDDPVVKGEAVGVWGWSNQFVAFQSTADKPMALHSMPGPNMEKGLFLKPSMFFSIANNSKQQEEAAKFIDFWVNNVEANKLINGDRGVPGSSVVKEALRPDLSKQQAKVFDYVAWAEENSTPMGGVDPIGTGEVIATLEKIVEQVNYDEITVEKGAKQFREEANAILSQNK